MLRDQLRASNYQNFGAVLAAQKVGLNRERLLMDHSAHRAVDDENTSLERG